MIRLYVCEIKNIRSKISSTLLLLNELIHQFLSCQLIRQLLGFLLFLRKRNPHHNIRFLLFLDKQLVLLSLLSLFISLQLQLVHLLHRLLLLFNEEINDRGPHDRVTQHASRVISLLTRERSLVSYLVGGANHP